MDSRSNVIAMMVLGAGIVALGSSIVAGEFFKPERPEKMGYVVEGVEEEAAAGGAAAEPPIATLLATADPAKGAEVFKKCASCHTINNGGANGIGPNLWGTLGEEVGHGKAGFAFSEALANKGGVWDWENMNAWLKSPRTFAPGTKMSFAGLSKPEDRANLLVYLNQNGSNKPLPAAPASGAAPTAGAAPGEGAAAASPSPAAPEGTDTSPGNTATPPGGPQPGGTPKGTSTPAARPNQ